MLAPHRVHLVGGMMDIDLTFPLLPALREEIRTLIWFMEVKIKKGQWVLLRRICSLISPLIYSFIYADTFCGLC